jgi:hypothetical protein
MPAPYSQYLRDRVASAVSSGSSARGSCQTVRDQHRRRGSLGTASACRRACRGASHGRRSSLAPDRTSASGLTLIGHQPDLLLRSDGHYACPEVLALRPDRRWGAISFAAGRFNSGSQSSAYRPSYRPCFAWSECWADAGVSDDVDKNDRGSHLVT